MDKELARKAAEVMLAYADGIVIEVAKIGESKFHLDDKPLFDWGTFNYRIKLVKPSIDWSHVSEEYNYLTQDRHGIVICHEFEPYIVGDDHWYSVGENFSCHYLASFKRGNCDWRESLVKRGEKWT